MKKQVLNIFTVVALCIAVVGCKKAKEADTSEAETVAVSANTSEKYLVNVDESNVYWTGSKPTGSHTGTIKLESGVFKLENGTLISGTFLIAMKSISCTDLDGEMKENLESHLKGTVEGKEGDFFDVMKHPTGVFEITGTKTGEDGRTMLSGNLALKGMKHNVTFPVSIQTEGDLITIGSDAFSIDRTKWGINYGSKSVFDNLGDKFINDNMELQLKITAKKS
jgi:polyisoprenoid-binding protein YceI